MSEPPFGHTRAQRPWFHLGYEGPESGPECGGSGGGEQRLIAGRSERSRGESPALRGLYQGRARGPPCEEGRKRVSGGRQWENDQERGRWGFCAKGERHGFEK